MFSFLWSPDSIGHDAHELNTKQDFLRGQSDFLESVLNFRSDRFASEHVKALEIVREEAAASAAVPPRAPDAVIARSAGDVGRTAEHKTIAVPAPQERTPEPKKISAAGPAPVLVPASPARPAAGPQLHIVTYASHGGRDDRFCRAVESAYHSSIELTILGWGVKWEGLSQKLYAAYHYAKSIPPGDVIMFVDAFDVMFAGPPAYILERFLASGHTVLFAAECGCWPQIMENKGHDCFHAYPVSPTPYRYLNSGTWIGYAKQSAAMLLDIINKAGSDFKNANDQKLVSDMFIHKQHGIQLDYYSTIFQSMHMTDRPLAHCAPGGDVFTPAARPISFAHNATGPISYYNAVTKSVPAVYHFNGGGKTYHLKYEKGMWYRQQQRERLRTSADRAAVFEGVANYQLRVIPTIADMLVDSEIKHMPLKALCDSYVRSLISDPRSI